MFQELVAWLEAGDAADLALEAAMDRAYQTGQPISEVIRDHADAFPDGDDGARTGQAGDGAEASRPLQEAGAEHADDPRDW